MVQMSLRGLSSDRIVARLLELRGVERTVLVEFLWYLAEVDRRKVYLEMGFSSLFAYCTDELKLTSSAAFRRTTAARLMARFPVAAEYLEQGQLNLTTLVELRNVLTEETCARWLEQAAGKTEDEVKVLVAAASPQPAPVVQLRSLPEPPRVAAAALAPGPTFTAGPAVEAVTVAPITERPRPAATVAPISEALRLLRVAVGAEFVADLERVKAALSHKIPNGDLEKVLHECIRTTLEACEKRRRGSSNPRSSAERAEPPTGRYIPVDVRREVWARDRGRCSFVGSTGRRCESDHQVEFHHEVPFAKGGAATVANVRLLCRQHNLFRAERDYGTEHMALFTGGP